MKPTTLWTPTDTVAYPLFGVTMFLPTLGFHATSSKKIFWTFSQTCLAMWYSTYICMLLWLGLSLTPKFIVSACWMAGAKPTNPSCLIGCPFTLIPMYLPFHTDSDSNGLTASFSHVLIWPTRATSSPWRPRM